MQVFVVCLNDYPHSVVLTEQEAKDSCAELSTRDPGPMRFYHYHEVPMQVNHEHIASIIRRNLFDDDEEYTQACRECAMDILSEKEWVMTMEQMAQRVLKAMTPLQVQELVDGRFDQLTITPMVVFNVDENKAIRILEKCREISNG